jgi:ubiquinone/menaquinone biosynthesis C-methylase UbiE
LKSENFNGFKTDSFDAIVSLSALEHIPLNQLNNALKEIKRVLKPNAKWAVTTSGTEKKATWFHEPSKGYCFSKTDIENMFNASNILNQVPEKILQKYKANKYLKENLAGFYFKSEDYGMPWGKWSPQYIPVGIYN